VLNIISRWLGLCRVRVTDVPYMSTQFAVSVVEVSAVLCVELNGIE